MYQSSHPRCAGIARSSGNRLWTLAALTEARPFVTRSDRRGRISRIFVWLFDRTLTPQIWVATVSMLCVKCVCVFNFESLVTFYAFPCAP